MKKFLTRIGNIVRGNPVKTGIVGVLLIGYYFCLPSLLFSESFSAVIESADGRLLGAKIATDGQWRFPAADSLPAKYRECVVAYEDEYFYRHPGFNPVSMCNAMLQNRKAGKVVRGGSTITQQVIRLSRGNRQRTYLEKCWEMILATRLELRHSKAEILGLYASHAPFGGNVVGLEMASWRYFGLPSHQLSWAQSATLAVLPNAPGLIYPGRNSEPLRRKRDGLLKKLRDRNSISRMDYDLALREPLPDKPYELPQLAPHLLQRSAKEHPGERIVTTIDHGLQERLNQIAGGFYNQFKQNEVHNLAILVVDVKTHEIRGYIGNSPTDKEHWKDVDIITAPRSTGSVLKPLLYAAMLDDGELLPDELLADIPIQISGFMPQNFDQQYDGAVPASQALSRSLNIPAVLMLQKHGLAKFYGTLKEYKLRDVNRHPDHYGLSLILGGAESNLWDLTRSYSGWASTLNYFNANQGRYRKNEFAELNYVSQIKPDFGASGYEKPIVGAGAIYEALKAMNEVNRPEQDQAWKFYDSAREVAWKTGTSFGNRDAWAIGVTPDYVVGVWVGNASGEGRPELTGVTYAAPVLFDVFGLLPNRKWFAPPLNDLEEVEICAKSGFLAGEFCPTRKDMVPMKGKGGKVCPYHKQVFTDASGKRVNAVCTDMTQMHPHTWFVLPPVMEYYYKSRHVDYRPLPPVRPDCESGEKPAMDFIYPKTLTPKIYLARDFTGKVQPLIAKVAHSDPKAVLFWYVDGRFLGRTDTFHEMPLDMPQGKHAITVVDAKGNEIRRVLEVLRP